jgi:cytoskeletal protein CcmA (bactofilin family)
MFSKTDNKRQGKTASSTAAIAPSIISANLHIVGNLKTEGEIQIDGMIDGDVTSRALTIGEKAKVKGEITSQEIDVRGSVEGRIRARSVKLSKTAHVVGDIIHEILTVESGAYIEGQLRRTDTAKREQPRETIGKAGAEDKAAANAEVPAAVDAPKDGKKEPLKAVAS